MLATIARAAFENTRPDGRNQAGTILASLGKEERTRGNHHPGFRGHMLKHKVVATRDELLGGLILLDDVPHDKAVIVRVGHPNNSLVKGGLHYHWVLWRPFKVGH